jgi:hypothetical protein
MPRVRYACPLPRARANQAIAITPDHSAVLVTSWHTNSIVRLNLTGGSREPAVWASTASAGLEGPFGLAIGNVQHATLAA